MTPIDITQPLALRGSPTVQFHGPFLRDAETRNIAAFRKGVCCTWQQDGYVFGTLASDSDLIPLQTTPRKWLRGWATYLNAPRPNGDQWGSIWPSEAEAEASIGADRTAVPMIEAAACDGLVEALRRIGAGDVGPKGIAQCALADWEASK